MEASRQTVYRSPVVTIRDMFRSDSAAAAIAESPRGGTITFIRYGVFAQYGAGDPIVVDANYVLFGNAEDYVFALGDGNRSCACTIVEYHTEPHIDALLSHRDPVLCSPRAYLMQARLLNDAWLRRADRNLDESASRLLSETLAGAAVQKPARAHRSDTVRAIKELLNRSLAKPISLAEVANTIYLSPFTVSRMFHREIGVSMREYVRRLRLRTALSRILDGARLTDVAAELGFYDEPHFSKAFHAEFGSAPALALGAVCDGARQ